ncbi:hypothetical protein CBR_g19945 [Chara braunii]|uniref:Integrase catalytic domain-containing protein n=1 Tax=Chara braunii TaxID=69332 RepID=A0A388KZD6_CHABU|nr:hypothetical protein CBR_g19945 [Chara braunii]|eukprot:GBG75313.1 hypothetical protein CBR_g19945 [Chara braunii]
MGGEAKQWVLAEANAAGFEDIGEWAKTLTLKQFLVKTKDRFLDKTTTDKAFDQLTSIGQKHWTSVEALSREVDRLLQVPGLNLQDSQVLYIYSRALPEPIREHLVTEAKSGKYNYRQFRDLALQREQMTSQVKNSYAAVVKSGGGGGERQYNGKRVIWRQKRQDHTLVVFDDDTVEKWPTEETDNNSDSGKGEVTAVVANKGGPPRTGTGKNQRAFPWHPGIADGKPWLEMGMTRKTWQERMDNAQCLKCGISGHRNKPSHENPLGLLRPLPIPSELGESISMDFMSLTKSRNGNSQVMVIVDHFSKYAMFIPLPAEARPELVIQKFQMRWVTKYGFPLSIVSDRDSRFTSMSWQKLMEAYSTRLTMSSGRHPETNGQSEQMNRLCQQLLRMYVRPDQIDGDENLPKIASAYNSSVHTSTGRTPNALHKGWKPKRPIDVLTRDHFLRLPPGTRKYVVLFQEDIKKVKENLKKAQDRMIEQANKHRRPSTFKEGDLVWVKSKEFSLEENVSQKLMSVYFGPWEVLKVIGDAEGPSYRIDIPPHLKTYSVFHASKLLPYIEGDEFPHRPSMIPPDMDDGYEVDRILEHRFFSTGARGRPQKQFKAKHPELAIRMYKDLSRWDDAIRVAEDYLPSKLPEIHAEVAASMRSENNGQDTTESIIAHAKAFERSRDFSHAIDAYLRMTKENTADVDYLQHVWDMAVKLAMNNAPEKIPEVVAMVSKRLIDLGHFVQAAQLYQSIDSHREVLLTSYLRCFSQPLRNQLAKEANINMHNFPSFRKVALDLEARIGHGQAPSTDGRKKTLPPNWKAKGRLIFVDNDGSTIEVDNNFQEGVGSEAGSIDASEGGVVVAVSQKGVVEREVIHAIEIIPRSSIPKGRIYRMSVGELDELRLQLKELVEKGWIRPSVSPYGSPVLFVPKKKEGTLRMCIDYRGLNAITVKNREPLPRIDDLLDRVQGCWYFSKIDLKSGYHQIAIRPEDQHKTTFQTRYGLYEFVVMPFGLCNAPGTFQHAMDRIFHDYLDKFVTVYLDDILIFSKTVEEHVAHLDKVLGLLRQHKFKINGEKCEFGHTRVLYLGHEISAEGLNPDDAKVASIRDWPRPQSVTKMRSFLGMTGYYRTFVKNYSIVAAPFTDLTGLDTPWEWTDECEVAFRHLKHALTHYEVLKLPDPDKPFIVTTDASQYGIGAVLAQQEGPKLRPVEYMSKKMPSQKLAKSTYEKELYAVYKALTHWRHYLLGRFFILRTDHQTLRWMRTQPVLSDVLKSWIEVIEQYDFDPIIGPPRGKGPVPYLGDGYSHLVGTDFAMQAFRKPLYGDRFLEVSYIYSGGRGWIEILIGASGDITLAEEPYLRSVADEEMARCMAYICKIDPAAPLDISYVVPESIATRVLNDEAPDMES